MSETQDIEKKLEELKIEGEEAGDELPKFDLSMKKKKKPKAVTFADDTVDPEDAPKDEAEADPTAMFSDLKKKKKKKKPVLTEGESNEDKDKEDKEENEGDNDDDEDLNEDVEPKTPDDIEDSEETWLGTDRDYTYQELLGRVFKILRQNNPELAGEKRRYTIVPPQVAREGSKKTVFANLADICKRLNRPLDHVVQFLFTELGTSGSIDGAQRLVIKGRFQQKQMEIIIRRYIVEYVTCKTCKSPETVLVKENRLFFLQCESCSSRRSVAAVNSGFQANLVKRAKRKPAVIV